MNWAEMAFDDKNIGIAFLGIIGVTAIFYDPSISKDVVIAIAGVITGRAMNGSTTPTDE
jgi:hypothetical protein